MEEVINSIHYACELAQNLESDLPNLTNQPAKLSLSIDEIVKTLSSAKERLIICSSQHDQSSLAQMMMMPHEMHQPHEMDAIATPLMQEWLRSSCTQTMDQLLQNQQLQAARSVAPHDVQAQPWLEMRMMGRVEETEASPSRPRRSRKADLEKRTTMVPAPQYGNTEMPPEDGFTWRKYGQKEILDKKYPRSYYRCTHQKLYGCPAKKQVQKLDHNPNILEVTYRGEHICHKSSTSPSFHPPPPMTQSTISHSSSISVSGWLSSMNLSLSGGGSMAPTGGAGASSSADPSNSKYGTEYDMVADMVDVMFNSGSSSGNSMESLFPPPEDKWEPSEKKR